MTKAQANRLAQMKSKVFDLTEIIEDIKIFDREGNLLVFSPCVNTYWWIARDGQILSMSLNRCRINKLF